MPSLQYDGYFGRAILLRRNLHLTTMVKHCPKLLVELSPRSSSPWTRSRHSSAAAASLSSPSFHPRAASSKKPFSTTASLRAFLENHEDINENRNGGRGRTVLTDEDEETETVFDPRGISHDLDHLILGRRSEKARTRPVRAKSAKEALLFQKAQAEKARRRQAIMEAEARKKNAIIEEEIRRLRARTRHSLRIAPSISRFLEIVHIINSEFSSVVSSIGELESNYRVTKDQLARVKVYCCCLSLTGRHGKLTVSRKSI